MTNEKQKSRKFLLRGVLAMMAAVFGWSSVADTLANVVVKRDSSVGLSLAPWDGVVTAKVAQTEMSMDPISDDQSHPAQLAREAIQLDPTAVSAFEVLGLQAQLRGDTEQARTIFSHSLALSRRELRPQIWAIEEAVSRGDIAGALHQYDIALRTSQRASGILFPALASAIAEPKVRAAVLTTLGTEPVWGKGFVAYVGRGQIDPVAAVPFFREGERVGLSIEDANRTSLVNSLARRGQVERAWDYYSSFRNVKKDRSRDYGFKSRIETPAVFDWNVRSAPGISATIQGGRDGGMVEFSAAPSVGGVVLDQRQVLPPGAYAFEGTVEYLEQPERSRPYWILTCQSGREVGRILIPNAQSARVKFTGRFNVPSGCPVQTLALVLRSSDGIAGVFGRVSSAQVIPVEPRE